ncbi:pilus assembly protein TadE, partial [Gardnerella vaginalis]
SLSVPLRLPMVNKINVTARAGLIDCG